MGDQPKQKTRTGFECGLEAQELLNCVANTPFNEAKCLPLLKKLRACVEKKKVIDFALVPEDSAPELQSQATDNTPSK